MIEYMSFKLKLLIYVMYHLFPNPFSSKHKNKINFQIFVLFF